MKKENPMIVNLGLGTVPDPVIERALQLNQQAQVALNSGSMAERIEAANFIYNGPQKFIHRPFGDLVASWYGLPAEQSSQVIATFSIRQGVAMALATLRDDTDPTEPLYVAIPSPTYSRHIEATIEGGFIPVPIPLTWNSQNRMENGGQQRPSNHIDLDVFAQVAQAGLHALFLSRSNTNPLGYTTSDEDFERIIEICAKNKVLLVVDEVYDQFFYNATHPSNMLNVAQVQEAHPDLRMVILGGSSKTLRNNVSWQVCTPNMVDTLERKAQVMSAQGANRLGQQEFLWLWQQGLYEEFMTFLRQYNGERLEAMNTALADYFEPWQLPKVTGGYFVGLHLVLSKGNFPEFQEALQQQGVQVNDNSNCFVDTNPYYNRSRAKVKFSTKAISELLKGLPTFARDAVFNAHQAQGSRHLIRLGFAHLEPEQIHTAIKTLHDVYDAHM